MNYPARKASLLKVLVEVMDLVLFNLLCFAFYKANACMEWDSNVEARAPLYWTIGNITYVISLSMTHVVLHNRVVRPERIVSRACKMVLQHIILALAVLGVMHEATPDFHSILIFYLPLTVLICLERLFLRHCLKGFRGARGRNYRTVILIGEGQNIRELAKIMRSPWNGYRLLGCFTDVNEDAVDSSVKKLGDVKDVVPFLENTRIDEVYCGLPSIRSSEILPIISYCERNMIRFFSVPNLQNYLKRRVYAEKLGDLLVLTIFREPLSKPVNRIMKRSFDIIFSALFLCTIFPFLFLFLGLAIKISSPGPVFFRQKRTGVDGKDFYCWKFRSMKVNQDSDKVQATKDDPRKTVIGEFMRKTNLDEMPQFINVLSGDMSIVGPRPHMLKHTEEYSLLINRYMIRHFVKPGITGWAQVTGYRGETKRLEEMEGRVKADIWYIENWNFWLDLHIIIKTVANMIHGEKKAY